MQNVSLNKRLKVQLFLEALLQTFGIDLVGNIECFKTWIDTHSFGD